MNRITVNKADGSTVELIDRSLPCTVVSAVQEWSLNGEECVKIDIKSSAPLDLGIGDSIEAFGRIYKLNRLPKVTREKMHLYKYVCEFEGIQYDLLRVTYDLTIDTTSNQLQDVSGDSFTGDLNAFMRILISNANRVFPGTWILGECPDTDVDTMTFGESDNCLSVLQSLCSKHDVQFEIIHSSGTYTINIKQVGQILPYTFMFGKGNGLYSLIRENVSSSNIITRLKVRGSTENITNKYRSDRLLLPNKTKGQSYIEDEAAIARYGVYESTKVFDIKPTFTGTVESVASVLEFIDTSVNFDLNATDGEGQTIYLLPQAAAIIHFNTGNLAGYEFEISSYDHSTHRFKLKKFTDGRGMTFPSETSAAFRFSEGDEYKILQITLPDELISAAEERLQDAAETYYQQNSQPKVKYGLSVTKGYLEHLLGGTGVIANVFTPGDYLPIKDDEIGVDKAVRIKSMTRNLLDEYDYKLTISDIVTTNIVTRVISELTEMDKAIVQNDLRNPARARANWRTSRELLDMVFDADGDYYTDKIKPLSIDTQLLSVGAKSMQFGLANTVFQPNYNGNANSMQWRGGVLMHYAIDEGGIRSWVMADGSVTFTQNVPYYLYAKCHKADGSTSGAFILTTDQIKVEDDANYWHFLIGTVSSVDSELGVRSLSLTYGFTMVNGRFIRTGRIESADGNTYFDLDDGEIGGRIVFTSNGQEKTLEQLGAEALESKNYINNTLPGILEDIQAQVDGMIEQFFGTYDPTNNNVPASSWTTTNDKEIHLGDLFYNTSTGHVFRWVKENGVYKWQLLQDSEVAQALALANDALALAGTKRRIFTSTPYTPYDVGDLWVQGGSGDIMRCKNAKSSGLYFANDWEKASKYTDNSALVEFINGTYTDEINNLMSQIDGKIESWFQASDPAAAWTTDEERSKHVGDTWFDSLNNALRFFRGSGSDRVKALITGNTSVYVWKRTSAPSWGASAQPSHYQDLFHNTSTGNVYTFAREYVGGSYTYRWEEVDDNAASVLKALARRMQDGSKLFKDVVPTVPYSIGDCRLSGTDIWFCTNGRTSGSYATSDWEPVGGTVLCWQRTYDQKAIDAYERAGHAQDTADGKRRVFVVTPYPPYDVGDLWVNGTDLCRCSVAKAAGQTYEVNDWVKAVSYDNTKTVIDGGLVTSGTIQVAGSEATILAGMTGQGTAAESIRFWAGAAFENRAAAPFRVRQDGVLFASKAEIIGDVSVNGAIRSPFRMIDWSNGVNGALGGNDHHDNILIDPNSGGQQNVLLLAEPVNIGRKVNIVPTTTNQYNVSAVVGGTVIVYGTNYFRDGNAMSVKLTFTNQAVELLGVGDSEANGGAGRFDYWLVTRKTSYTYVPPQPPDIFAFGRIGGRTSNGACTVSARTWDSQAVTAQRTGTGQYTVSVPSASAVASYYVILTGEGLDMNSGTDAVTATVINRGSVSFTVRTKGDTQWKDGSFHFVLLRQ